MFRYFVCILMVFGGLIPARANISLMPFFVELDATSRNRTAQVRFTNTSNQAHTYNIKMVNFKQNADGSYTPINDPIVGNPFADKYLEWAPHQVTLEPNQSQVIRIQRQSMATASDGEYVSHLLIQEQESPRAPSATTKKTDGVAINLTALYGVSIPVMIENGDLSAVAKIESVKIIDQGQGPIARVNVVRSGTRSFTGTLVVRAGRREYGRVEKFRIFLTTPNRVIDIPLTSMPPRDASVILIDEKTDETLETKHI